MDARPKVYQSDRGRADMPAAATRTTAQAVSKKQTAG